MSVTNLQLRGVLQRGEIIKSFSPPIGLRNPHIQSTLPTLWPWRLQVLWRARHLRRAARAHIVESNTGVRLQALSSKQDERFPWVIIMHGWLGHAESTYVLSLATKLYEGGYNICRLNLRDHGGTEHLNQGLFHSCLLGEVVETIRLLQNTLVMDDLSLAGFSLGANFALRVASQAAAVQLRLRKVVAICPPINPHACDAALALGPRIYRQHFLYKWKRVLRRKETLFPNLYQFGPMLDTQSITQLTDRLVQQYAGFSGVRDYYDGYSLLGNRLSELTVPSEILLAQDDPIVPVTDAQELLNHPYLKVTINSYGGHCGFMQSVTGKRWADSWALDCLG